MATVNGRGGVTTGLAPLRLGGYGLPLKSLGQLRREPQPEIDWLVSDLLPRDGLSLCVAPPKVGKSTLARCLCAAVATGGEWLGRDVVQGPVLHLALEERRRTVLGHYNRLGAPDEGIHLLVGGAPAPKGRLDALRFSIEAWRPSLVVIDPLARWTPIRDGNDYASTTDALTPLIGLAREYGTHLMLLHHSRKSGGDRGEEVLGSTAFFGSVDVVISLEILGERRVFYAVGRDDVEVEKTLLTMDAGTGWVGAGGTKCEVDQQDLASRIYDFLTRQDAPVAKAEIEKRITGRSESIVAALTRMVRDGELTVSGAGKRGDPVRYSVSIPIPGYRGGEREWK